MLSRLLSKIRLNTGWLLEKTTAIGKILTLFFVTGLLFGLLLGWIELVVAGVTALVLILLALPFLFGSLPHTVDFKITDKKTVAGREIPAQIEVNNTSKKSALPVTLDLPVGNRLFSLDVKTLSRGSSHKENVVIPGQPRSVLQIGPARIVRSDPLMIFKREWSWNKRHTVFVHPVTAALPSVNTGLVRDLEGYASKNIVSDDLSFYAIRDYRAGDLRRHVHWKSTAKTGALMVRQYEETTRSQMLIVLDTRIGQYRDEEEFELAVSAAASFALRGLKDGRNINMIYPSERTNDKKTKIFTEIDASTNEALLNGFSRIAQNAEFSSLQDCAEYASRIFQQASIVVIVTGSAINPTEIRASSNSFRPDTAVLTIVSAAEETPGHKKLGKLDVISIGILEDLTHLLIRRA
ncbi:MAG TPA: DUF58 domain-containing protein [Microbacteriaceae bacterium]|nr:DUF58 domain-containing protein [Microbacteriaceae bacterium]